jgi:hypothetical protein
MPTGEDLLALIRKQSAERRANPRGFLCEFLQTYWQDYTDDEQRQLWERQVEQYPWYAEDVLVCIDAVLADLPPDLGRLLEECGSIHVGEPGDPPPEESAYAGWLAALRRRLGQVYDQAIRGS